MNDTPERQSDPNDRINQTGQVQLDDLELERPHIVREMVNNITTRMISSAIKAITEDPKHGEKLELSVSGGVDNRITVLADTKPGFGGVTDHKTRMTIRARMVEHILRGIENGLDQSRGG